MKWHKLAKMYDPDGILKNWSPTRNWKALVPLELKHWVVLGNLNEKSGKYWRPKLNDKRHGNPGWDGVGKLKKRREG